MFDQAASDVCDYVPHRQPGRVYQAGPCVPSRAAATAADFCDHPPARLILRIDGRSDPALRRAAEQEEN